MHKLQKPENIFLVLFLIFGFIFAILNPPIIAPDEHSPIFKVISVSDGNFFPKDSFEVPVNMRLVINTFIPFRTIHKGVFDHEMQILLFEHLSYPLNSNGTSNFNLSQHTMSINSYSPLLYLACALVYKIGSVLNSSALFILYLCRIINLLIFAVIVYFAIKIVPIQKYMFLLIVLMPTTVYEATSISADSLTIALSFLLIAYILNLALVKDNILKTDTLFLFVLTSCLALTKPLYVYYHYYFL
jgi:uncharacterized membrane protein